MVMDPSEPFDIIQFHLVKREGWGALPTKCKERFKSYPIQNVAHNFTETEECFTREQCVRVLQDLQRRHMEEGHPDIKYNFMVGGDWSVYEGRGWRYLPPKPWYALDDPDCIFCDITYIGPSPHVGQKNYPILEMRHAQSRILEAGIRLGYLDSNYNQGQGFREFIYNAQCSKPMRDPTFKEIEE